MVDDTVDHEELEEMDDDRDRDVQELISDVTDPGEDTDGVVDLLGYSWIVSAGRVQDLIGKANGCERGGGHRSKFAFIIHCRRILRRASTEAEHRREGLLRGVDEW